MIPEFFRESIWGELALVAVIAVVSVGLSQVVVFLFERVFKALTARTPTSLDDLLVEALKRPIFLFSFVWGLYAAFTTVNFLDKYQHLINRVLLAIDLTVVVYALARVSSALMIWYAKEIAPKTESTMDERVLPIVRRIVTGVIYSLGALTVLRVLGLDISPLLAGLGIGGLAIALALQPTLNNMIAGAFTVSESKIGVGDYIRLEEGSHPEGVVQDIGWRTTKIKTPQDNLVVIPNARLADTVVTNFGAPTPETVAMVNCGVSYESDLNRVHRVAEEVARAVLRQTPGAVAESEPVVRFRAFGDSNIAFEVLVRVRSFPDRYPVTTALIKGIHERFQQEGIQISYPVRRLITIPESPGKTLPG